MFCSAVQVAAVDLYLDVRIQIKGQTKVRNKGKSFVLCDLDLLLNGKIWFIFFIEAFLF
jgi:hypothetical protein